MQRKLKKSSLISFFCFLVLAPLSVVITAKNISSKNYFVSAIILIILAMIPFFFFFEKRKIKTSEVVLLAVMTSLCVSSRAVFAFLPQVKPLCAFVIVTAVAFGPNAGFVTGALSMFVSNFIFGQGIFTAFQMLGMGLVGFFCALLFYEKKAAKNRLLVSVIGGVLCFFVYGLIVDSCSVLMMTTDLTAKSVFGIYLSGASFNLIHAVSTAVILFLISKPMNDKFERLRTKYGIFSSERITQ